MIGRSTTPLQHSLSLQVYKRIFLQWSRKRNGNITVEQYSNTAGFKIALNYVSAIAIAALVLYFIRVNIFFQLL